MSTRETGAGRAVAALVAVTGLAAGAAYLSWRVVTSGGAPWWLGAPTLAVEVVGWFAVAVTCWALWRRPVRLDPSADTERSSTRSGASSDTWIDAEVVVRSGGAHGPAAEAALRATLLSARRIAPVVVLDLHGRPEIAALAAEHGARYVATDPDDLDGTHHAAQCVDAPSFLLLEAGDVAHPGILRALAPFLDDASVAVVQAPVTVARGDSAEHGAGGRHDLEYERHSLHPSLGARGLAPFAGCGALVRTAAVRDLDVVESSPAMVRADLTASLFHGGWRIVAPGGSPLVVVGTMTSPAQVEDERACEASAARHLLLGSHGAWRPNRLSLAQRLALTALAVRPLAGVRRSVVVALLLGALLAGRLPFTPDPLVLAATWVPWFVLSALGLHLLSGGRLRPGDRVRWSMRMLGASWRGLLAPDGRPDPAEHVLGGVFGLHHGVAPTAAVGGISVVIGMRALSDRVTHTLAEMPLDHTAALLVVALWSLAGGLDALRILARRVQSRRATRIASSLPSTFGDGAALVVDLTPLGAGVLADRTVAVGSEQRLEVVVPTASGVVSAIVPAVVRNARPDFSGERRYGVEFGRMETYVADALSEYCTVQPALERLGAAGADPALAGAQPVTVLDDSAEVPRRLGLRAAALVAVTGAMATAVPGAQVAADLPGGRLSGVVSVADVATGGPVVPSTTADGPVTVGEAPAPPDTADLVVVDPAAPPADDAPGADGTLSPTGSGADGTNGSGTEVRGAAGAVAVVVCSLEAGADGEWGTSDDRYGPATSTVTDAEGRWGLEVDGRVCWAAIAPPPGLMPPGETSAPESPTTPVAVVPRAAAPRIEFVRQVASDVDADGVDPAGSGAPEAGGADATVVVADIVWLDADADGVVDADEPRAPGVTLTLIDDLGVVRGADVSGVDGSFRIDALSGRTHRLLATNLPDGWVTTDVLGRSAPFALVAGTDVNLAVGLVPVDAIRTTSAALGPIDAAGGDDGARLVIAPSGGAPGTEVATSRVLAVPADGILGDDGRSGTPVGTWLVVVLGTLIGVSVLAGSLRPARVARPAQSTSSPAFAIK